MKIRRLEIRDYRGVRDLGIDVPPAGAVIKGRNGEGKTSVLKAISAALAAQDIGPDAIRNGADKAEILIDLDAIRVRRAISAKATSVTLTTAEGATYDKPQTRLTEMLGTAAMDALGFYLAAPPVRRKLVLEAIPCRVTAEQVGRWTGKTVTDLTWLERTHGLEVLEQLRKKFYDERAQANKIAKQAESQRPPPPPPEPFKPSRPMAEMQAEARAMETALAELRNRAQGAAAARTATAKTREKAARLRAEATAPLPPEVPPEDIEAAIRATMAAKLEAEELASKLEDMRIKRDDLANAEQRIRQRLVDRNKVVAAREGLVAEAEELESSLAEVDAMEVLPEDILGAEKLRDEARTALDRADEHASWVARKATYDAAMAEVFAKVQAAGALDKIVTALTTAAPVELAAAAPAIEGLTVTDDKILLDGVSVDALSGAQQMEFAVKLAKRLNAKAKILVCDGLERLDSNRMIDFVKMATADDWQLIATRVADGQLVVEAIEWAAEAPAQ